MPTVKCFVLLLWLFVTACASDGNDTGTAGEEESSGDSHSDADGDGDADGDTGSGDPFPDEIVLETVTRSAGYAILEGPVWGEGEVLYFSDVDNNTVYQYKNGDVTLFRSNSNGTNGLMFDLQGRLCACEGGAGRLTVLDESGAVEAVLTDAYEGNRYNRPNDLVFDAHGGVYFTDPTWDPVQPQPVNGVYYVNSGGTVTRVISDMDKPNGIVLSPDQGTLYVDDWSGPNVRAYDVTAPGILANPRDFARLSAQGMGGAEADGMTVDTAGNLYVATAGGIQVFSPDGESLGMIEVQGGPTNCTFGGVDMKTLFITTRPALYQVAMNVPGFRLTQ